jgi:hypothetical protein
MNVPLPELLRLNPYQWILLLAAVSTVLVLADAWAGHFRRGFVHLAQYIPFPVGGLLAALAIASAFAPERRGLQVAARLMGEVAFFTGLIGFLLHHYYGVVRRPGGYRLWLHRSMYGAPPLGPLALTLMGAYVAVAANALLGGGTVAGHANPVVLMAATTAGLAGAIAQAALLHFRGSFNQPLMWLPLTIPVLTVAVALWMLIDPARGTRLVLVVLLWLTLLAGFVGAGMHLRGLDRQMGGLYVALFNWLQGPPSFAPVLFASLGALGLASLTLP